MLSVLYYEHNPPLMPQVGAKIIYGLLFSDPSNDGADGQVVLSYLILYLSTVAIWLVRSITCTGRLKDDLPERVHI